MYEYGWYEWHNLTERAYDLPCGILDYDGRWHFQYLYCSDDGSTHFKDAVSGVGYDHDFILECLDEDRAIGWKYVKPFLQNRVDFARYRYSGDPEYREWAKEKISE